MKNLFNFVKENRDQTTFLGIILISLGIFIGTLCDQFFISSIFLYIVFPIGILILMYGYFIKYNDKANILLIKSILVFFLIMICFYVSAFVSINYFKFYDRIPGLTLIFIFVLIKINKLKRI